MDGVPLQTTLIYMKFSKEVPVVGANGFYHDFAPAAASQACISFEILHVEYI